ncbi:serine/threonine-protein kinase [Scopulibacillus darangshiensis]|uniref:Serine/threonine-protein kinase n=1 Tax=Scopulibacillus darangshiensis TaxID=442528 RepID=A0A4R2NHE5_9BACL|nr:protein kinase [Scopulibacillus darangshiensis]TCP20642.1 serine/threonine-protein kinase [Scopulibacillus darangshiensis]
MNKLQYRLRRLRRWVIDRPFPRKTLIADRYEVKERIGAGSYGLIYLCRDLKTNNDCVMKQMRPSRRKENPRNYECETSIMEQLTHPAIPKLLNCFQYKGHLFFVMEYISGESLETAVFENFEKYNERQSLQTIYELTDPLLYLHDNGIIHRDIRLPNVIRSDGKLFLIDFGLARFIDGQTNAELDALEHYPEEIKLRRQINFRSDFYAMGHFLLYLLYSSFEPEDKKEQTWQEELDIGDETKQLLKRMLQIDKPYVNIRKLRADLERTLAESK